MRFHMLVALLAVCLAAVASDKPLPSTKYRADEVEIAAKLYAGKDQVRELLGSDLGGSIVVVELTLTPKTEKVLKISRDEFTLKSDKDGQRSEPFAPSQIAGSAALVVGSSSGRGAMMSEDRGPVWGGPVGGGAPRRLGGEGATVGNSSESTATTRSDKDRGERASLLEVLKQRVLPEKELSEPVTGLLYFLMDGKHKPKDLELQYKGAAGKFALRFK